MFGDDLPRLPPTVEIETKEVLKSVARAHRYLAELKVLSETFLIPQYSFMPFH